MANLWNAMHLNDRIPNSGCFSQSNLIGHPVTSWSNHNPNQVMEFTAITPNHTNAMSMPLHTKRKPAFPDETLPPVPAKKMITEDAMAAHLSNLHISGQGMSSCPSPDNEESMNNYTVNMSQWDLERKLRTAQKITVCNEILDFDKSNDPILPEILLNRMSKPCSALILWQPPPTLDKLLNVHNPEDSPDASDTAKVKTDSADEENGGEMEVET